MIKSKLENIIDALEEQGSGVCHYLERDTGLIHTITDEVRREVKTSKNIDPNLVAR